MSMRDSSTRFAPLAHLPVAAACIPRAQLREMLADATSASATLDMLDLMLRLHVEGHEEVSPADVKAGIGIVTERVAAVAAALEAAMRRSDDGVS